jgi:hypothetical protein
MKHQAIAKVALMLSVLFVGAASAQASPVRYDDIFALATVVGQSGHPSVDLRMRAVGQQIGSATRQVASTNNGGNSQDQKTAAATTDTPSTPAASHSSSLTGTEIAPPQTGQQSNVETVELGEVQGTICDCGPIPHVGGFPKWPLLALGAVPFFFIHQCDNAPCDTITETPTPTPTTTPPPTTVPEPATIFLLGTGLLAVGARARRSYAVRPKNDEAGEV